MKCMWKCEKCGKEFEDMELAVKCEDGHYTYDAGFDWDDDEGFRERVSGHMKYEEGNPNPIQIAIMLRDDYYDSEREKWVKARGIGIYKLVKVMPVATKDM